MSYTEKIYFVVQVTREDGSTFLASGNDGCTAHFFRSQEATEFKKNLGVHISPSQLKTKKARIRIEVLP